MAGEFGGVAAQAAHLASSIGSDEIGGTSVMADSWEELPSTMKHVLKTLGEIRANLETTIIHREELRTLEKRCTYVAACFVVKDRQSPSVGTDVAPFQDCVNELRELVHRCGARDEESSMVMPSSNENEIIRLANIVRNLETDFHPTDQATTEGKTNNIRGKVQRAEGVAGTVADAVADFSDAAAEAVHLASKICSDAADAISFVAGLGEEFPFLNPVIGTLRAIREKIDTVKNNREELVALEARCRYMTACVIVKSKRSSTSEMNVTPLEKCVEAVDELVVCCTQQGCFRRCLKASSDKDKIAGLKEVIRDLEVELSLAGVVVLEGKVDDIKADTQKILECLNNPEAERARVPKGTPARKSWHVERRKVMERVFKALTRGGGPQLVGLVGDSGSGKTTAASEIVRSINVREAFSDGIVWLTVNEGANECLPSLMRQLARTVFEDIGGSVGSAPSESGDGAAYVKQFLERGLGGKGLRCLVVADNVWEEDVVSRLLETGMWILLSTRDKALMTTSKGTDVVVDELSKADAESVLRSAAELSPGVCLPNDAIHLIELCGRVAMDLAFVGRWSIVRGRQDQMAWSDAAAKVRTEVNKIEGDPENYSSLDARTQRRKAILRAGFEDLATGSGNQHVERLYLSLAVMPDDHDFTVRDAAVLLYDRTPSVEDEESTRNVTEVLERWTVLGCTEGKYRMHASHAEFARESIRQRGDVRLSAVRRWVAFINSLDTLRSNEVFFLKRLWLAVERVGGKGFSKSRPYVVAAGSMDDSDPLLMKTLEKMGWFQDAQGDWEGARTTCERLLGVLQESKLFGKYDPTTYLTLRAIGFCARQCGRPEDEEKWEAKKRDVLPLVVAKMESKVDDGTMTGVEDAIQLSTVGQDMLNSAPDDMLKKAEKLLEHSLKILEAELGGQDVRVAYVLYDLGVSARQTNRLEQAEDLLNRSLKRLKDIRGEDVRVGYALYHLGLCVREAGRLQEAEDLLRLCLSIREEGGRHEQLAATLFQLGVCVRKAGKVEDAETLLLRCLHIDEKLGRVDSRLASTLYQLGVCARKPGNLGEAETLFRRSLSTDEAKLGSMDVRLVSTLYQLATCVRDEGRFEEAEGLVRRCLGIVKTKLSPNDVVGEQQVLVDHQLDKRKLQLGWLKKTQDWVKQYLAIGEAKLGCKHARVDNILQELGVFLQER